MKIAILIPCYNEERRIEATLSRLIDFAVKHSNCEIVVEEDGSRDSTPQIIDSFAKKYAFIKAIHSKTRLRKGGGLILAALHSTGDIIITTDADLAVPPEEFPKLAREIENGWDIVIASRRHRNSLITKQAPFFRRLASLYFNRLLNLLFDFDIRDTQSGTKAFKREVFFQIQPRISLDYAMDVEMLARAKKRNLKIKEIGVHYEHGEFSRFSILRNGSKMLRDVFIVWLNYIAGRI
ncbi:MAG: glycosyltransferase [Methanocellales archaeon]